MGISAYRDRKYRALACYRSQLLEGAPADLSVLDIKQREPGAPKGYAYAEALKVLPGQLHCNVDAWRS